MPVVRDECKPGVTKGNKQIAGSWRVDRAVAGPLASVVLSTGSTWHSCRQASSDSRGPINDMQKRLADCIMILTPLGAPQSVILPGGPWCDSGLAGHPQVFVTDAIGVSLMRSARMVRQRGEGSLPLCLVQLGQHRSPENPQVECHKAAFSTRSLKSLSSYEPLDTAGPVPVSRPARSFS
jgi:hypothetical protein